MEVEKNDYDHEDLSADDAPSARAAPLKKNKTASETYQKACRAESYLLTCFLTCLQLTQLEHILKRPDTYIGSVEMLEQPMWTYDIDSKRMVNRKVSYVPGFFKIVDEILVNAADNKVRPPSLHRVSP